MQYIISKTDWVIDLLEDIIKRPPTEDTTLVVCSSKDEFLRQIMTPLIEHRDEHSDAVPGSPESLLGENMGEKDESQACHRFLAPTFHLLSASQKVRLVFCPTTASLRAYLSSYGFAPSLGPETTTTAPGPLMVLGLVALHHGTSEFTVQGLSRTFSTAAAAAHRVGCRLRLAECKDIHDPSNPYVGPALWEAEVPLLSGSVKIGEAGAHWARRTISIRKIARRWFDFEDRTHRPESKRAVQEQEALAEAEEEMLV